MSAADGGGVATSEKPAVSRDTEFFWAGLEDRQLLVQECNGCGALRHPPRPVCAQCASMDWKPHTCTGRGSIYSYTVVHHPPVAGRTPPYPVALVELDEGVRILAPLDDVPTGETPAIGAAVVAGFQEEPGAVALVWRNPGRS